MKYQLLVALWAVTILLGLGYASSSQLREFDPNSSLSQAAMQADFDSQFTQALNDVMGVSSRTIVHFQTQDPCFCNTLSEQHQTELRQSLSDDGYELAVVNVPNTPQWRAWIPSFPALAVIGENRQLRYLGPYSAGYGCLSGENVVDAVVALTQQTTYLGANISSESKGCYCNLANT